MAEKTKEQKERDQKLVDGLLEFCDKLFPEELKEWIYKRWPHGFGLYDQ